MTLPLQSRSGGWQKFGRGEDRAGVALSCRPMPYNTGGPAGIAIRSLKLQGDFIICSAQRHLGEGDRCRKGDGRAVRHATEAPAHRRGPKRLSALLIFLGSTQNDAAGQWDQIELNVKTVAIFVRPTRAAAVPEGLFALSPVLDLVGNMGGFLVHRYVLVSSRPIATSMADRRMPRAECVNTPMRACRFCLSARKADGRGKSVLTRDAKASGSAATRTRAARKRRYESPHRKQATSLGEAGSRRAI